MAANKESIVIILDVGIGAEKLTKTSAEISLNVIKNKIFNHKTDMLSLLLLRTEQTQNVGNSEEPDQYLNICQVLPGSQIPTWDMAKELTRSLETQKSKTGDWVDALIVAIGILTEDSSLHKTRLSKIVLFHNFDSPLSSLDDALFDKLNELDCKLIIVSDDICYEPDSEGNLAPHFKTIVNTNTTQIKNQELAMELKNVCSSTIFCNFSDALPIILCKKLQRPWCWNSTLSIGSRIVLHLSGVIAIKEEANVPKFQKKSKSRNESIVRQKSYYSGVDELTDDSIQHQISGYMLGNTAMPFDPTLGQAPHIDTKKGIYFIGFVSSKNIPHEHFAGSSTYVLFPQKNKPISAKKLDSLVRVMVVCGTSILSWKVYNNSNKPKLVVLIPTLEHKLAGLSMIELSYNSQHRFWDFPRLCTKKKQPTSVQLAVIDQLVASMDLDAKHDTNKQDRLCLNLLPNIRQQILINYLTQEVLKQPSDKSSANYAQVSDFYQPGSPKVAEKIKELFILTKSNAPTKDKLKNHFFDGVEQEVVALNVASAFVAIEEEQICSHVSTLTPAEDFNNLITHVINKMPNGAERSAKFHQYTCQMSAVISDLLFKSMTKQYDKICQALTVYRKITIAANSSYDYNDWMRGIRAKVIERKMFDFWEEVIVKNKLGLCLEEDSQTECDFYDISKEMAVSSNVDTGIECVESVEDLFDNM